MYAPMDHGNQRRMPPSTLTLKQRLSALSMSPSAPSSPSTAFAHNAHNHTPYADAESPKRSNFFNAPWAKSKRTMEQGNQNELARVQDVIGRLIFQAGVDYETRPMVILNASALPDPRDVNYDLLLSRVLSYLNLYVEADYTVVFFAAGSRHTPGWNWVWKAYRGLNRNYRKNLKRLYIVHSTFFTKMLFSLAGAIISPKFFRKITYMDTLSELATEVPITQIDIPAPVYQENTKHERKIILPVAVSSSTFGVPLADLMGSSGENAPLPRPVKDAIQFLRDTGLNEEGLFRRSPSSALLRAAQDAYDRGNVVSLENFGDPHLAAVLIKKFLRDLPEPVFGEELYALIRRCPDVSSDANDMTAVAYVREVLLPELEPCVYILVSSVLNLMHEVSLRSTSNRMDAHNLAVVLTPNLVKSSSPTKDVMMCVVQGGASMYSTTSSNKAALSENKTTLGTVVKLCISRYYEIFDEVRDRSEALPPSFARPAAHLSHASEDNRMSVGSITDPRYVLGDDEEDSLDDRMLVMPLGHASRPSVTGAPSAWEKAGFKPRHRSTLSGSSSRSVVAAPPSIGSGDATPSRARSTLSIDHGFTFGTGGKKGSISIGRGTVKNGKGAGAGVEAIGVTAEGFFSAPSDAPPVPSIPGSAKEKEGSDEGSDIETPTNEVPSKR
ncbi:RhoGAP-domain-containing protein [Cylindrobasidium torrendii FP15055 ss-10]|uniref:RhoGAP-domain-containing protein n=1 Tax=Cylindrobasidium torrendii FP15055 ss-10 TaxID=1314674 RepID=A0A0D7B547_9AGAR|nr:RhoGAP-domain-containing protein [Cylindrobasidium torrendii FP15055 ss-10]